MEDYIVKKTEDPVKAVVDVPGSKSITNRALLISALSDGKSTLNGVLFSDDSRVFIAALQDLEFKTEVDEDKRQVTLEGEDICKKAEGHPSRIYVGSAGTAARFLTALLALSDGKYIIDASEQMKKRPMLPLFEALTRLGAEFTFTEKSGYLPAAVKGTFYDGGALKSNEAEVDSDKSTQFLSALLMTAPLIANRTGNPFSIKVNGSRARGSYVKMTLDIMKAFGVDVRMKNTGKMPETVYCIAPSDGYAARSYIIEPDVSGACYFYAAAAITCGEVIVRGVHSDSIQGDIRFLDLLVQMGCTREETLEGIKITGPAGGALHGISADMKDSSDQTMTLAAIAPFCDSPVEITGIGHIRGQESDRIHAIATELSRMGIKVEEGEGSLKIHPGVPQPAMIETYNDHRIAMAFSLVGLRCDGIVIKDYECCKKTFENYFEILDGIIN